MKPLPFLCTIIGLNILWLSGFCELSSERGNLGVCPLLPSSPLAPAWLLLPVHLCKGYQDYNRVVFAGLKPSLLFPRSSVHGEGGRVHTPTSTRGSGCGGTGWQCQTVPVVWLAPSSRAPSWRAQADEVRTLDEI